MSVVETRPVVYRIKQVIIDRLRRLTAGASPYVRIREVIDPTRIASHHPQRNQIIVAMGESDRQPDLDLPGYPPAIARNQTFYLRANCTPSEKDPTPIDEYREVISAEVIKCVGEYGELYWWTFDSLAINADWGNPEPFESPENMAGVSIPLIVTYRTDESNPYTAR